MPSVEPRPWIEILATRAQKLAEARESVAAKEAEMADVVRHCFADGCTAAQIAEAAGLSRARVYQIRDGRR